MRRILLIITFLAASVTTFADDDIFSRPAEVHLVVDSADVFTTEQYAALTAKLDSFERVTTVQIQIYTTYYLYGGLYKPGNMEDCQPSQEARREARNRPFARAFRRNQTCPHHDFWTSSLLNGKRMSFCCFHK